MGRACGKYGEEKKCVQSFGFRNPKERANLEDLGADNIKSILKKEDESLCLD